MKKLFVTVGSTKFPELIHQILSNEFISILLELEFTDLIVQAGSTSVPSMMTRGLDVQVYSYKPSILEDMRDADMIISHAGSGSILEALSMDKKLLVVINDLLMDNHQIELAQELSPEYLLSTNISDIKIDFIKCYHSSQCKKWNLSEFSLYSIVREELGM